MTDHYAGQCICGAVAFAFDGAPAFVAECVCESCRRAHGATVVGWVGVETERFQLTQGEAALSWYRSSEASERGFCTHCGTRLFFRSSKWPGETHMALACMTAPHDLTSTGFSFAHELPQWSAVRQREKEQ